MGLNPLLLEAISSRGFEAPTPIQAEMIPFLLNETQDVVGLAQTGTGKTAAFGLPILQKLDLPKHHIQALILVPTRELCRQVSGEISDYGRNLSGLRTAAVYGGTAFGPQIKNLRSGVHLITATPGRLKDLLDRNIVDLEHLRFLVLDEADQMLDMGFKDDLDAILQTASPDRRTLLFSATMPPAVARIASTYMTNPHEIVAGERNRGTSSVEHRYYRVHASDKYAALRRLIDVEPSVYGIIFCRTRETVKDIAARLGRDGYAADALHGELSQVQRESVMQRFRQGNPSLLVATDVAARGLDVDNLTHVIHYDLPDEPAVYNHRSGRTGRAGKTGTSLTLVHLREGHRIRRIEQILGRPIKEDRIPGAKEICETRLLFLVNRVLSVEVNDEAINPYLQAVREKMEGMDREELLRRFLSVEFNRFLEEYGSAPDLNPPEPPRRTRREALQLNDKKKSPQKRGGRIDGGMIGMRINLGRHHRVLPPQIIGLVNQATRTRNIRLGRIDIGPDWSELQVESAMAQQVEEALRNYDFQGRQIQVERIKAREGNKAYKGKAASSPKKSHHKSAKSKNGRTAPRKRQKK